MDQSALGVLRVLNVWDAPARVDICTSSSIMEQTEEVGLEERLKSALWLSIGKIVDEETIKMGVNATPQFIGALTEMVWTQIETVSQDLESFAKHAGRSTVNVADVMLLARRNEGLDSILRAFVEQQRAENS